MSQPRAQARTEAGEVIEVSLRINGSAVSLRLPARVTLSDAIRDQLGLTGTHIGCEHGICGMCTVLVDGQAARACLLLAVQLDGADITTVEGLGRPHALHPLQESFGRHHALQCGFCTPGFLMSAYDLLRHNPEVTRPELPAELAGVLCRCTGYRNIIDAVDEVATAFRGGIPGPGNCVSRPLLGRSPVVGSAAGGAGSAARGDGMTAFPEQVTLPGGEPTVDLHVTSELVSAPAAVGRVLLDARRLVGCLPGAELSEKLGDNWYRGRARVFLGPVQLSFRGVAHVIEQSSERMEITAKGDDPAGGGGVASVVIVARPSGSGTLLEADAKLFLTGRLASFGRSLLVDVSRRIFEDFARAIDRSATGVEPDAASGHPPGALPMLAVALGARLRAQFTRLRRHARRRRGG